MLSHCRWVGEARSRAVRNARLNVVAVALFLIPLGAGIAWTAAIDNPLPVLVAIPVGITLALSPRVAKQWERAVVLRLGRYVGLRGPGLFWIVPVRGLGDEVDRSAGHHDQLRRGGDADVRHGAGQRGRGALLAGLRPGEGRARGAGLSAGGQLGGADGAARHHRPDLAHRSAARARADRRASCRS